MVTVAVPIWLAWLSVIVAFVVALFNAPPGMKLIKAGEAKLEALPLSTTAQVAIKLAIMWANSTFLNADGSLKMAYVITLLQHLGLPITAAEVQAVFDFEKSICGITPATTPAAPAAITGGSVSCAP